jgi:hypothetical protein
MQRGHDLITDIDTRHRVDGRQDDIRVTGEHEFDGRGCRILSVDAQPVVGAAGEVHVLNRALANGDGPILAFRRWASKFYSAAHPTAASMR